jgi:hypothetical protein
VLLRLRRRLEKPPVLKSTNSYVASREFRKEKEEGGAGRMKQVERAIGNDGEVRR